MIYGCFIVFLVMQKKQLSQRLTHFLQGKISYKAPSCSAKLILILNSLRDGHPSCVRSRLRPDLRRPFGFFGQLSGTAKPVVSKHDEGFQMLSATLKILYPKSSMEYLLTFISRFTQLYPRIYLTQGWCGWKFTAGRMGCPAPMAARDSKHYSPYTTHKIWCFVVVLFMFMSMMGGMP